MSLGCVMPLATYKRTGTDGEEGQKTKVFGGIDGALRKTLSGGIHGQTVISYSYYSKENIPYFLPSIEVRIDNFSEKTTGSRKTSEGTTGAAAGFAPNISDFLFGSLLNPKLARLGAFPRETVGWNDNLEAYAKAAGMQAATFLQKGEFKIAYEMMKNASDNLASAEREMSGVLSENIGPEAAEEFRKRLGDSLSRLVATEHALEILLSANSASEFGNIGPGNALSNFLGLPPQQINSVLGANAYQGILAYLAEADAVANCDFGFMREVSQPLAGIFSVAEKSLRNLKDDIARGATCDDTELAEISKKWGIEFENRMVTLSTLRKIFLSSTDALRTSALLDMEANGTLEAALARNPDYALLSFEKKEELLGAYHRMAAEAREKALGAMGENYRLADAAYEGRTAPPPKGRPGGAAAILPSRSWHDRPLDLFKSNNRELFLLLQSKDAAKYLAYTSLVGLVPGDGRSVATAGANHEAWQTAVGIRNLNKALGFEKSLAGNGFGFEEKKWAARIAKAGLLRMVDLGEGHISERPQDIAKNFDSEMAYACQIAYKEMGLQNYTSKISQGISNSDLSEVWEGTKGMFSLYGKDALTLIGVGLMLAKGTRPFGKLIITGIATYDIWEGNVLQGTVLLAGMYGNAIPKIGNAISQMAAMKMCYDGFSQASESIRRMAVYGATVSGTIDTGNSVLMGMLLPAYHGYAGVRSARNSFETALEMYEASGLKFAPLGMQVSIEAPIEAPKMLVLDTCYFVELFTSKRPLTEMLQELANAEGGELFMPKQVLDEIAQQMSDRRRHGKNMDGIPEDALLVPSEKYTELLDAIYSRGLVSVIEIDISEALPSLSEHMRQASAKGNSRVGAGEAGIFELVRIYGEIYGNNVKIYSKDSDVTEIAKMLPFKVPISFPK